MLFIPPLGKGEMTIDLVYLIDLKKIICCTFSSIFRLTQAILVCVCFRFLYKTDGDFGAHTLTKNSDFTCGTLYVYSPMKTYYLKLYYHTLTNSAAINL